MKIHPTSLAGLFVIEPERHIDQRGWFARSYCAANFTAAGLNANWQQANISYNILAGTVRGLHWQTFPHDEIKLVRCTRGSVFDIIVDLRRDSTSFGCWLGITLSAKAATALYIDGGLAHGFQTLEDESELHYLMGADYCREAVRGIRHDDPDLGINWPLPVSVLSEADRALPSLAEYLATNPR